MEEIMGKVHQIQLEMALEVKRICEKHNIKYSIIAGTLLGAVRHNGFIPWDDDLDIGMLRKDYEKFIAVCNTELRQNFFLQTQETDSGFALPIAKLRKLGTRYVEKNSAKAILNCGIYIDIFPFDNVPNWYVHKVFQDKCIYILKRILLIKMDYEVWNYNEKIKKILYKTIKLLTYFISTNQIKKIMNKVMILYNRIDTNKVVTFGGSYGYKKETISKDWLESLEDIYFENVLFSAPKNYKEYLSYFYGDYMTPPPEGKRFNRHNIIEIYIGEEI